MDVNRALLERERCLCVGEEGGWSKSARERRFRGAHEMVSGDHARVQQCASREISRENLVNMPVYEMSLYRVILSEYHADTWTDLRS